jgi:uncharacterized membrane protein YraQ (UPF0718 family)
LIRWQSHEYDHGLPASSPRLFLALAIPLWFLTYQALFIGFVQAGVPLGITFSFLIAAPMVNEIALTLLFGLFGFRVAALYLGLGLTIAIVSGWVIGRLKMESYLEDWVQQMPKTQAAAVRDDMTPKRSSCATCSRCG